MALVKQNPQNPQNPPLPYCLNAYKDMTKELCITKKWHKSSVEQVWLLLTEEIGELAGSIRRSKRQYCDGKITKIEDEMGDVFSYMFQLSHMLNIDLDLMWHKNQIKAYNKNYALDNKTSASTLLKTK